MDIAVIGGGSLGLMWTARLMNAGINPILIVRTEEQQAQILRDGLTYTDDVGRHHLYPYVESMHNYKSLLPEVVILAVKQTHLESILPFLQQQKNEDGYVLTLQNGLGHMELLSTIYTSQQIVLGTTSDGAYRHSYTNVERTGCGNIWFGQQGYEKPPQILDTLLDHLRANRWTVEWDSRILTRLWRKCLINCAINPLTAILEIENGKLPEIPHALRIMRAIFDECVQVAQRNNFQFDEDTWQEIIDVCRNTSRNRSSMLQDIQRGNRTEIAFINGYIVQRAKSIGIDVPTNAMMVQLVHAKEEVIDDRA